MTSYAVCVSCAYPLEHEVLIYEILSFLLQLLLLFNDWNDLIIEVFPEFSLFITQ